MNKSLIAFGLAFVAITAFSSCKKDYVCNCTTVTKLNDSTVSTGTSTKEYRAKRNNAKDECKGSTSTAMFGPFLLTTTETCAIQ